MPRKLNIPEEELRALDTLNGHGVAYLLIGGFAMRFYGADREVADVDVLTRNSPLNAKRLFRAIQRLVDHPLKFSAQDLEKPKKRVTLENEGYDLEILTSVDGLEFKVAYQNRKTANQRGVAVPVASKEHLLFIKRLAANDQRRRAKELRDISFLEGG